MSDAESDLLRELSKELDSISEYEEDSSSAERCKSAGRAAARKADRAHIQRMPRARVTQDAAPLRAPIAVQCSPDSSARMSPVPSCENPLSPTSTTTLAQPAFTISHASSYLQPSSPVQHTSTSCTSVDADHLLRIKPSSTVPSQAEPANTAQAPCAGPSSRLPPDTAGKDWAEQHPQPAAPLQKAGEVSSEPRPPQRKRPRVRNRATAHLVCDTASNKKTPAPVAKLPHDVLQNILQHASAADLTRAACTCKALNRAAGSEALWRRLYCARWGAFRGGEEKIMGASFWKRTYMARDAADHESHASSQDEALRGEYHSMLLTEREATVPAGEEPSWNLLMGSAQEQVAAFVRARGFSGTVQRPADLRNVHLVRFGDVFVDEKTGWLHVCDKGCDLQAPDDTGAFMVCPLTGRMHGRVAETWDGGACGAMEPGDAMGVEGAAAAEIRDADGEPPPGGWMARVYEAGYCHNEEDDGCIRTCALLALELTK